MPEQFSGRTVLVCGAGVAGLPAVRALVSRGAEVLVTDAKLNPTADELGGAQFLGALDELPDVDLVVTSPGWRPDNPLLTAAADRGIPVWGEVEFAWRLREPGAAPWLMLTGTNGKTTTVRMLESILRAAGKRALAVGNVGISIIDAVTAAEPYDVLAVEVSSFQLHWSSSVIPAAGALLNIAPDHIDWHGSMEEYTRIKTMVWSGPVAIGNIDDPTVAALLEAASGEQIAVTVDEPGHGQFGVIDGMLIAPGGVGIISSDFVRPPGQHNISNALIAAALASAYGVSPAQIAQGLRDFVPDPHRNQQVGTRAEVRYVDDSKATNPHAARASLEAYDRIVWIAGGQLKGAPIEDLVAQVAHRLVGVVLLGVDRAEVADALARHAPDVPVVDVATDDDGAMTEVVRAAAALARAGDTVLLAPAAASYDMFSGYAARGTAFVAAMQALDERA